MLICERKKEQLVSFFIPIYDPLPPQYFIRVISDRWLGSETVIPITLTMLTLPEKYPPPRELLDLQPKPVSSIEKKSFRNLFSHFKNFNPIQTQTFNSLYKEKESVLICAPASSGKITCAEFALLHMIENHEKWRCVYLSSNLDIVEKRYKE